MTSRLIVDAQDNLAETESDSDDDLVMPEGPAPGDESEDESSDDSDDSDDIPMPEGPPPPKADGKWIYEPKGLPRFCSIIDLRILFKFHCDSPSLTFCCSTDACSAAASSFPRSQSRV